MTIAAVNNDSDGNSCDINRNSPKFPVPMYIVNIREGNYTKVHQLLLEVNTIGLYFLSTVYKCDFSWFSITTQLKILFYRFQQLTGMKIKLVEFCSTYRVYPIMERGNSLWNPMGKRERSRLYVPGILSVVTITSSCSVLLTEIWQTPVEGKYIFWENWYKCILVKNSVTYKRMSHDISMVMSDSNSHKSWFGCFFKLTY